ncbi:unnamed protein product [Protopolystoma xenopodis]|uniref:Glutaredoxin domain-containing protein n=1 Tax=Protopolystoma xenopodis TaxID=117903 RepID=A0A448WW10_9PLAT|nr:unnamed protein product [Protopolystoma xenopodis]
MGKPNCPFCAIAKNVLAKYLGKEIEEKQYKEIDISAHPDCQAVQDALLRKTGARTVPRVFISGICIGGGTETRDMDQTGELKKLLS